MTTTNVLGSEGTLHPMARAAVKRAQQTALENQIKDLRAELHAYTKQPAPVPQVGATGQRGEKGEAGRDGKDGKNGKDGRDAVGVNGHHGTNGRDGKDGAAGPDSAAVLASTRAELANVLAKFEDLKLVVNAIHGQNRQCDEYINFLRQKAAARRKS